jgi:hypothetical protein
MGIGVSENNYGLKEKIKKSKQVGEYDMNTNELLQTFDSILFASEKLSIPFSSLSTYIRCSRIYNDKIYRFIENEN